MSRYIWLTLGFLERVHERQLELHGGASGVRDIGLLESALARPQNAFAYGERDICNLAALYAEGVIKNHPFVDGNKRTGFVACLTFLSVNGLEVTASLEDRLAITIMLAAGEIDASVYAAWLRDNTTSA